MTTLLQKIIDKCACGVSVEVNPHKNCYQSIEQHLSDVFASNEDLLEEINKEVLSEVIKRDTLVNVHVYPHSPVGFFSVYHYDLEEALKQILTTLESK